ncbi:MAG: hypothetical protein WC900_09140 [Oscillospiraceae bacterium]
MKKLETGGNFLIDKNIVSAVLAFVLILVFHKKPKKGKKYKFAKKFKVIFGLFKGTFTYLGILKTKDEIIKERDKAFPVKIEEAIIFDI